MPRFSVIVPVYNQAAFLPQCLESLLAQELADWECIVVDDGSTDETPQVIARFAEKDARIVPLRQGNGGMAAARNAGAGLARGEWIAFLDADDFYHPPALAAYARAIEWARGQGQPARIVSGILESNLERIDPRACNGAMLIADAFFKTYGVSAKGPKVLLQSAAFARTLLDEIGLFSTAYVSGADRELLIRATAVSPVVLVQTLVAFYRRHSQGMSERYLVSGEKIAINRRMYRALAELPVVRARVDAHSATAEAFRRAESAYLHMLDCAEAIRAERWPDVAVAMRQLVASCATPDELASIVQKLFYYLHVPPSNPPLADERCAAIVARLYRELGADATPALRAAIDRAAAHFGFTTAATGV